MIASVYIKDKNINFYNENREFTSLGGFAYELGKPLLDFICYEPKRFDEAFSIFSSMLDNLPAHHGIKDPRFLDEVRWYMGNLQQREIYVYFYMQLFMEFIYTFVDFPRKAVKQLAEKIPAATEQFRWVTGTGWAFPPSQTIIASQIGLAAKDAASLMSADLRNKQAVMTGEIQLLINFRTVMGAPEKSSMEYLYYLEEFKIEKLGYGFYLENPLRSFYGVIKPPEIVQLYEIDRIDDLFRFEFIKMIENDIFIKKCKNCERFFIPSRRADAEYCERIYGSGDRKCSEVGATIRHERKVSGNPVLEAHKKAYRRFNSRTRAKKMTQSEFLQWSDEARRKRDACLAGTLPFDEYVAWLEQGRIRKARGGGKIGRTPSE